jgi:hypothetical protein
MEVSGQLPGRFAPGKEPPVPIGLEAEWAPKPVWTRWRREKFLVPTGNRIPIAPIMFIVFCLHVVTWAYEVFYSSEIVVKS